MKYFIFIVYCCIVSLNLYSQDVVFVYDSLWNKLKRYDSDSLIYIENKSSVKSISYFSHSNNENFPIFKSFDSIAVVDFTGTKKLNIDNSIENLKCIKILDFQLVHKLVFNKSIGGFPSLQILRLSQFQYFKDLPQFIYSCNELLYLSVRVKDTGSIDYERLASLTHLQKLDLSFKKSSSIPQGLLKLNSLKYLSLYSVDNLSVNESILSLSNLKCLSLNVILDDKLFNILTQMPNLEGLVVDSIALNKLEDVKKLNYLKFFYVLKIDKSQKDRILTLLPSTCFGHWSSTVK